MTETNLRPSGDDPGDSAKASGDSRLGRLGLVAIVATAAPLALLAETTLREWLFPPEFEDLRRFWEPTVTDAAWFVAVVGVFVSLASLWIHQRWALSHASQARAAGKDPQKAVDDRTFLSMSIPQVPALFAMVALMVGAQALPVLICVGTSTLAVFAQGLRWETLRNRTVS